MRHFIATLCLLAVAAALLFTPAPAHASEPIIWHGIPVNFCHDAQGNYVVDANLKFVLVDLRNGDIFVTDDYRATLYSPAWRTWYLSQRRGNYSTPRYQQRSQDYGSY